MTTEFKRSRTVVIDSSYVVAYLLSDESVPEVEDFFEKMNKFTIYAPPLLRYEVTNALITCMRQKRLSEKEAHKAWKLFASHRITFLDIDFGTSIDIAVKNGITAYDASYIVLADDLKCPLLTLDNKLNSILR